MKKVMAKEGDLTIDMPAPANVSEGDILSFYGVVYVAGRSALAGRRTFFHKRGTLKFNRTALAALNGGDPVTVGVLKGVFVDIAGKAGWKRCTTLVGGTVPIGLIEGFDGRFFSFDDAFLDLGLLPPVAGGGGEGPGGDAYDDAATQARFGAIETKNLDQDFRLEELEAASAPAYDDTALTARMTNAENVNGTQTGEIASLIDEAGNHESRITNLEELQPQAVFFTIEPATDAEIEPGDTLRLTFGINQALRYTAPDLGVDGIGFTVPHASMHQVDFQLRFLPITDEPLNEAGKFIEISMTYLDDPTTDFMGRLDSVGGFWVGQHLSTIVHGNTGHTFVVDVKNTHETDSIFLLYGGSAIIVRSIGSYT